MCRWLSWLGYELVRPSAISCGSLKKISLTWPGGGVADGLDELAGRGAVIGAGLPGDAARGALGVVGADGPDVDVQADLVAGVAGDRPAVLDADVAERHATLSGAGEDGGGALQ